jgi:hypothetical protein
MAAQAKMMKEIINIKQETEDLSAQTVELIRPELRPEFRQQVDTIKKKLSGELGKEKASAAEAPEEHSELRESLNKCIYDVIKLGKTNGRPEFKDVIPNWHDLRVKCESITRRLELYSAIGHFRSKGGAPRAEDVYAQEPNIMYLAEKGDSRDVPTLLRVKDLVPYSVGVESPDVPALLDEAIDQIYRRTMTSIKDLCEFYGAGENDLARLIGLSRAMKSIPRIDRKIKTLMAIRDSLRRQFPEFEIRRWLHNPNPAYKGLTPVQAIFKGGMVRVLDDLNRLEEGVPN